MDCSGRAVGRVEIYHEGSIVWRTDEEVIGDCANQVCPAFQVLRNEMRKAPTECPNGYNLCLCLLQDQVTLTTSGYPPLLGMLNQIDPLHFEETGNRSE
jgi:hypothetical protein